MQVSATTKVKGGCTYPATATSASGKLGHEVAEWHLLAPARSRRLRIDGFDVRRKHVALEVRRARGNEHVVWVPVDTASVVWAGER